MDWPTAGQHVIPANPQSDINAPRGIFGQKIEGHLSIQGAVAQTPFPLKFNFHASFTSVNRVYLNPNNLILSHRYKTAYGQILCRNKRAIIR
ncbi:MAG: hypothetical protein II596_10060, partial [Thermoguttaceae bacterium]|nr:hypothetical protein [Thermoguttaceae bacterium]